jgi:hypothetical protein
MPPFGGSKAAFLAARKQRKELLASENFDKIGFARLKIAS